MVLLSMASLLGIASVTGGGVVPPPVNPITPVEPLTLASAPLDKGDYRDQDIASLTVFVGQRDMSSSSDWKPVDSQTSIGLAFDSYRPADWVGVEAAFFYSKDDSQGAFGQSTEISLGARRTFTIGESGIHPYVGAGAAYVWSTFGFNNGGGTFIGASDDSVAFYAHGGAYYTIARVNVGLDVRAMLGSDLSIAGFSTDADYVQYGLTVGYGF